MPNAIPVKVVVVTMYERGTPDDGDIGEMELWIKREKLDKVIPFPVSETDLRMNDDGILAVLTGMGASNAASVVTALACDPRFDFSKAYWLVAGIAGVDPIAASIGSAAWAEYVVDGDIKHELDSSETPDDWPYGKISLSSNRPNHRQPHVSDGYIVHKLNPTLVEWAFQLTKDIDLGDAPELEEYRKLYKGLPNAVKPPFILKGDCLSSSTYWFGEVLNKWARDWVQLYTEGKGKFVMANMEDHGTTTALYNLSKMGIVDYNRVMVLRTASNYSYPPPGEDASWHFEAPFILNGMPAFEAAYNLGAKVIHELVDNWETYRDSIPQG